MKANGNTSHTGGEAEKAKCRPNTTKLIWLLVPFTAIILFLLSFGVLPYAISYLPYKIQATLFGHSSLVDYAKLPEIGDRRGGLLSSGFDEESCRSRYNTAPYRRQPTNNPSSLLISKLRNYETLHEKCGPHTKSFREALENLKSGKELRNSECKYVVWISHNGLGNRILSLASTFLYALLTNRVLLVDSSKDMSDLFCEPFPRSSWLLPKDYPLISQFDTFNHISNQSFGYMLKTNVSKDLTVPSWLLIYLAHDYEHHDKLFYTDQEQSFVEKVPWLIIYSDSYFVPSLFLIKSFEQELLNLFPEKEYIFHFLGRYLFHPTNQVWGLVTRFYDAYLEKADEKIGVQIRVLLPGPHPLQYVHDRVLSCLLKEKILPEITNQNHTKKQKHKAVLVTSLYSGYYEKLRDMYWENPTTTGDVISFFQPTHEYIEQNQKKTHNIKAWAEIYLLSLMDKLVTSSKSTFGNVAQGLGGLRPWILYTLENQTAHDPPCQQGETMEPCSHAAVNYDWKTGKWVDTTPAVPYLRRCEDVSWGIKLLDVKT